MSADALAVARANLAGLGRPARRVRLVEGDWFDALPDRAAAARRRRRVEPALRGRPTSRSRRGARLGAGRARWSRDRRGSRRTRRSSPARRQWLRPEGSLVLEIGATQGDAVSRSLADAGFADVEVHPDLAGRDRVVVAGVPPMNARSVPR